jgi:glycosyltransferase involved in cell wall biosynthesis
MNKELGVIQIIDSLETGGAEVLAVNIANALCLKGINSHICVTRKEGRLKENINTKVGYLFLSRKKTIDFKSIITLKKYIKKNNIKIIHAHSSSLFIAFCVKLLHPKVKIYWHDHYGKSQDLYKRPSFFLKIMSFFVDSIISVNSSLKKWAENTLNCNKVYFLNNFPSFSNIEKKTFLKGIEGKRIVHLAAFRAQKDHETLIEAFSLLIENNKNWTLHLVGNVNKDIYANKILALIDAKGLKNHIFVYGSQLDIKHILSQATIGVLSSKSEGLPIALLEYGLTKLPVVVTNVGECSNVIENGQSGIVVEKENSIAMTKALEEYVLSADKRSSFGNVHFKNMKNKYSQEHFIIQLKNIYTL